MLYNTKYTKISTMHTKITRYIRYQEHLSRCVLLYAYIRGFNIVPQQSPYLECGTFLNQTLINFGGLENKF